MRILENLQPKEVFYFFEEICNIPHGSENEKKLSDYIVHFAQEKGLFCRQDGANNVLVKKAGTKGYETAPPVILQSHIDMVCEKNGNVDHDFETQGIKLMVEEGKIKAKGTTLGADNGIGAAYMLALLAADNISHPPLEAVFTTDEERGMHGAKAFDAGDLEGKTLINLDTEEEGEFVVSCCGGNRTIVSLPIVWEQGDFEASPYLLKITGLTGGHSGSDIHLQRASANKLMGRILFDIFSVYDSRMCRIDGGLQDNAIPREAEAVLLLKQQQLQAIEALLQRLNKIYAEEYEGVEENITLSLLPMREKVGQCFSKETTEKIISILLLLPYGVETMDMKLGNLVESSSNVGVVETTENTVHFHNAIRSSLESRKQLIADKIRLIAKLTNAQTVVKGEYPEWTFSKSSAITALCQQTYQELYQKQPVITYIHAGLECGIFAKKIPGLDMISIGPEIRGAHSPEERVDIASVQRVWEFLQKVLCKMR